MQQQSVHEVVQRTSNMIQEWGKVDLDCFRFQLKCFYIAFAPPFTYSNFSYLLGHNSQIPEEKLKP